MNDDIDPKGLIRESYRIEGIKGPECRSIFLEWAISRPEGREATDAVALLLDRHGKDFPDHPMTKVLADAMEPALQAGRRGGARARRLS
ncbi:MAG: hypothetical protein OXH79_00495 [Boseongicola sp.]|nr:hypothetical protein [Boseongicola sp.]